MTTSRGWRTGSVAVAAAVLALLLVPTEATYLSNVGSDTVEHRTAACGPPVASLLGADPALGVGVSSRLGADTAPVACRAASSSRALAALGVLLVTTLVWGARRRALAPLGPAPPDHALAE